MQVSVRVTAALNELERHEVSPSSQVHGITCATTAQASSIQHKLTIHEQSTAIIGCGLEAILTCDEVEAAVPTYREAASASERIDPVC